MFSISTLIEGRVVEVTTRATRKLAEAYVAAHAHGCLPTMFITDVTPRVGTRSAGKQLHKNAARLIRDLQPRVRFDY